MRIGIDAKRLFFNSTGLGNYGRQFVHALAAGLGEGDEIVFFCPKSIENSSFSAEFSEKNIRVVTPRGWFGRAIWRTFLLPKILVEEKIDAFYGLSNELPFGIHRLGLKTAVVIHDLIFLRHPELYPMLDAAVFRWKTRYAARAADLVIAPSEQTRLDLAEFYQVLIEKIAVIPPPVDPIFIDEEIQVAEKSSKGYCVFIGAFNPRKNLLVAMEAFSKLKFDIDFLIAGEAKGKGRSIHRIAQKLARNKGLEGRVHFLGKVEKTRLPALYRRALFSVYPSIFEGFGMPVAESLACGTPAVTSRGGCFREAGGGGAIYIDPKNAGELAQAMSDLATDEQLRRRLAEAGLRHVKQFRPEKVAEKIRAFHQKLLDG